jgi:hypothetical protein
MKSVIVFPVHDAALTLLGFLCEVEAQVGSRAEQRVQAK